MQTTLDRLKFHYSAWNRRKKILRVNSLIGGRNMRSALFVGVNPSPTQPATNVIEESLAQSFHGAVALAILPWNSPSDAFKACITGDGQHLPFADNSFDLVFSNAVIEHVGDQRRFVEEHARVGRNWIITTPNRSFPIEAHTSAVMRHWSRSWSHPTVSRLLSRRTFQILLPDDSVTVGSALSPTLFAYSSALSEAEL